RRRQQQTQLQGTSGKRRKRPTVMRGMMI
ncbi:type III secretion protein, partial [Vibrio parahaemolyticus]|nr:type III secretion protein [Vibrio parahaemolyticus]